MRFGLKEDTINKINEVFSHYPLVSEVIIYGSRAKGIIRMVLISISPSKERILI